MAMDKKIQIVYTL